MKRVLACAIAILFQLIPPNFASAETPPKIVATLDLARKDTAATDAFYTALTKAEREPFYLNLTIKPHQDADEAGYTLNADVPSANGSSGNTGDMHVCGDGIWGTIDNFRAVYKLGFRPFEDNHSGVEITIGDRVRFPFHNMICSSEGYTSTKRTPLLIEGHFVVSKANIPTAIIYTLFPFDP